MEAVVVAAVVVAAADVAVCQSHAVVACEGAETLAAADVVGLVTVEMVEESLQAVEG